jgi:polyvinyl alcohol dehydrogenase (cytochrome)
MQTEMAGRCSGTPSPFSLSGPSFNGWGVNPENWRYQTAPGIAATQLGQLDVKWAFGFPGAVVAFGQPTIVGNRVFVGSQSGHVYALDVQTGCCYWDYTASAGVLTALTPVAGLIGSRRADWSARQAVERRAGSLRSHLL